MKQAQLCFFFFFLHKGTKWKDSCAELGLECKCIDQHSSTTPCYTGQCHASKTALMNCNEKRCAGASVLSV